MRAPVQSGWLPFSLLMAAAVVLVALQGLMAAPSSDSLENLVVRRMEAHYHSAKTLQATFLERYTENGREVRTEAGTAYFRRPGKMRWEYESPEKNMFLVDGKTAWFYVPGDHTVTRMPAKESMDWRTPLALLACEMKVSRVCARVASAPQEKPQSAEDVVISCILRSAPPKEKNPVSGQAGGDAASSGDAVFFEVARESGEIARVLIRSQGGVSVEFRFKNWFLNPPLSEAMFRFQVPAGVVIVTGDLKSAGATER